MLFRLWTGGGLIINLIWFISIEGVLASETLTKVSCVEALTDWTVAAPSELASTSKLATLSEVAWLETAEGNLNFFEQFNKLSLTAALKDWAIPATVKIASSTTRELAENCWSQLPAPQIPEEWEFDELSPSRLGESEDAPEPVTESGSELVTETEAAEQKTRNWSFSFTPYVVVPLELSGDASISEVTAELDVGFSDIIEAFDFALFGQFEALYRERLGFYFNGYYTSLSSASFQAASGLGQLGLTDISVEAKAENQQAYFDLAFIYRFRLDDNAPSLQVNRRQKGDAFLDLMGGVRVQYLNQTIDLDISIDNPLLDRLDLNLDGDTRLGSDNTWAEPLLRTSFGYAFNEKLAIITAGEVSGFGIGDLSLTWRALAGIDWIFAGNTSFVGGYTVSGFDYEVGSGREQFGVDVIQHGPFFAFKFRF